MIYLHQTARVDTCLICENNISVVMIILQGVHLKLRFLICLLEKVIFSYIGQNIWQNFGMCWTF